MTLFADQLKRNSPTLYNLNMIGDMKHCRNCANVNFQVTFSCPTTAVAKARHCLKKTQICISSSVGKTNGKCKFCPLNL